MTYFRPALALTLVSASILHAQAAPETAKPEAPKPETVKAGGAHPYSEDTRPLRTFYLKGGSSANDGNEVLTAIRLLVDPDVRLYLLPSLNAISVRASATQLQTIEKILADLDRTRKEYRLTYTLTEMDGGKRIGLQNFAIVVAASGRTTLKNGSKIPIVTGSNKNNGKDTSGSDTQITYLDIGINIDASIDDYADGARLRTKVEQSSAAEDKDIMGVLEPVIRQSVLEGTSFLAPGKPLALGSFDIPGTTRHLEVSVVMQPADALPSR